MSTNIDFIVTHKGQMTSSAYKTDDVIIIELCSKSSFIIYYFQLLTMNIQNER